MSFFPAKLKIRELTCWHIERPEPEHHGWKHCHEYNFTGEFSIIPRSEAIITEFYLELAIDKGLLKVDSLRPYSLSKIIPDEPISNMCSFQVRLSDEIRIPSYGYVVLEFNRGRAKKRSILH